MPQSVWVHPGPVGDGSALQQLRQCGARTVARSRIGDVTDDEFHAELRHHLRAENHRLREDAAHWRNASPTRSSDRRSRAKASVNMTRSQRQESPMTLAPAQPSEVLGAASARCGSSTASPGAAGAGPRSAASSSGRRARRESISIDSLPCVRGARGAAPAARRRSAGQSAWCALPLTREYFALSRTARPPTCAGPTSAPVYVDPNTRAGRWRSSFTVAMIVPPMNAADSLALSARVSSLRRLRIASTTTRWTRTRTSEWDPRIHALRRASASFAELRLCTSKARTCRAACTVEAAFRSCSARRRVLVAVWSPAALRPTRTNSPDRRRWPAIPSSRAWSELRSTGGKCTASPQRR